jgi:hypothetical protein
VLPGLEELGVLLSAISMAKHRLKNNNIDLGETFGYWNARRNVDGNTHGNAKINRKRRRVR